MYFYNMQLSMCEAKHGIFCKKNWITNSSISTTVDLWIDLSRGILIIWNTWFLPFYIWFLLFWLAEHVYSIRFKNVCQQVFKNILIFFQKLFKSGFEMIFCLPQPYLGCQTHKEYYIFKPLSTTFFKKIYFFYIFSIFLSNCHVFLSLKYKYCLKSLLLYCSPIQ